MTWALANWRLIAAALLVAALGLQTYRLRDAQAERDVLTAREQDRMKRDALRAAVNLRNKERTDEELAGALRRASAVRIVPGNVAGGVRAAPELAVGGDGELACFGRGELRAELAGFAQRAGDRLARLLERDADRLSSVAEQGEQAAAVGRALRAWALSLATAGDLAPGAGWRQGQAAAPLARLRALEAWPPFAAAGRASAARRSAPVDGLPAELGAWSAAQAQPYAE